MFMCWPNCYNFQSGMGYLSKNVTPNISQVSDITSFLISEVEKAVILSICMLISACQKWGKTVLIDENYYYRTERLIYTIFMTIEDIANAVKIENTR